VVVDVLELVVVLEVLVVVDVMLVVVLVVVVEVMEADEVVVVVEVDEVVVVVLLVVSVDVVRVLDVLVIVLNVAVDDVLVVVAVVMLVVTEVDVADVVECVTLVVVAVPDVVVVDVVGVQKSHSSSHAPAVAPSQSWQKTVAHHAVFPANASQTSGCKFWHRSHGQAPAESAGSDCCKPNNKLRMRRSRVIEPLSHSSAMRTAPTRGASGWGAPVRPRP